MNRSGPLLSLRRGCTLLLLSCALAQTGCTLNHSLALSREWLHTAEVVDHHQLSRRQQWTLPVSTSLYIAFPDSHYRDVIDLRMQQTLAEQLGRHFPVLERGQRAQTRSAALQQARILGIPFVVYPQLLQLRDKTDSGEALATDVDIDLGRDRVQVQLLIFDSINQRLLDSAIISSRSSWLAWFRRAPEDMFAPAFALFAQSLSGAPASPQ
ncbi:DUF4823 domain-containing protein [Exilibacterium tricleocarpae]|uniref:DUF4823 domain-containing protein n=1 Tax=Exilibacterium tricleocarpae TaxID=2591008 RepID=A0A545TVU0_9GAMM|nr:DUF4823 domain-containing protein [Exilibacterium tricleocarpae]TQV81271.1 DUF4823 domain-containing protein [Exilibacterium tricleocarpae]